MNDLLIACQAMCGSEQLIVRHKRARFVESLGNEAKSKLARCYMLHQGWLDRQAAKYNSGESPKDQSIWGLILVLKELDRVGDSRFKGSRFLGREKINASRPQDVSLDFVPDDLAHLKPLFQVVVFARFADQSVDEVLAASGIVLPKRRILDFEKLEKLADQVYQRGDRRTESAIYRVCELLSRAWAE